MELRRPPELAHGSPRSGDPGTLLRLGWMLAGPVLLAVLGILIWMSAAWTFTIKDALFWSVVFVVLLVRYADVVHHRGTTVYGEPATRSDLRRYAIGFVIVCAAIWIGAQSFQLVRA